MSNTITKLSPKEQLNVLSGRITGAPGFSEKMLSADLFPLKPTTLEIIQSNSLLLNAQISLAESERNFILSKFNLLKSIGLLSSDYLKIK